MFFVHSIAELFRGRSALVCLMVVVWAACTAVDADNFRWIGGASGDFSIAANWENTTGADPAPPDAGDAAVFDDPVAAQVSVPTGINVAYIAATNPGAVELSGATPGAMLDLTSSGLSLYTVGGRLEVLDLDITAAGSLNAFGGGRVIIGDGVTGTFDGLDVTSNSQMSINGADVVIDASTGVSGAGIGSTNSSDSLGVYGGATLITNNGQIGSGTNAFGYVDVDGDGSLWTNRAISLVSGKLTVTNGGVVDTVVTASTIGSPSRNAEVEVRGVGSRWDSVSTITLGGLNSGVGQLLVRDGGVINTAGYQTLGGFGAVAVVVIDGPGSAMHVTGNAYIGPTSSTFTGTTSRTEVRSGALLSVDNNLNVEPDGRLLLSGGEVQAGGLVLAGGGVSGYGRIDAPATIETHTQVTASGGVLSLADATATTLFDPRVSVFVDPSGTLEIDAASEPTSSANISLAGGGLRLPNDLTLAAGGGVSGYGIVVGQVHGFNALTTSPSGTVDFRGQLDVGGSIARIYSQGQPVINGELSFSGGQINTSASNTIVLGPSGEYRGYGNLGAERLTAQAGSLVRAEGGTLTVGSTSGVDGFFTAGALEVGAGATLVLRDADHAVVDSSASISLEFDPSNEGTLTAANGLLVDFGASVTGHGLIDTPDDIATPLTNNGAIVGESLADPITLSGYVKGVGSCDNCVITGTDAPGFSPSKVTRGSVRYEGVLEIEVGGLSPGGDHDQVNHLLGAGVAELGGELLVEFINDYTPTEGDSWRFLTATGGVSGVFTVESLPALGGGLALDVVYGPSEASLAVVGLVGDYNGDGAVDAADYTVYRDSFGQTGVGLAADGNLDGVIDSGDHAVWAENYGRVTALSPSATVPEPSSGVLLFLVLSSLGRRR